VPVRSCCSTFVLLALLFSNNSPAQQQNQINRLSTLSPAEELESYEVYTAILRMNEPTIRDWKIVIESFGFEMCLKPNDKQKTTYQPILEDYTAKNKTIYTFERKFSLPSYSLITRKERLPNVADAVFSAVGFDREQRRAAVCYFANSTGYCVALIKENGAWQHDEQWRGASCGWSP
jgi:hypothetical protein